METKAEFNSLYNAVYKNVKLKSLQTTAGGFEAHKYGIWINEIAAKHG